MKSIYMNIDLGEIGEYEVEVVYATHPAMTVKHIWLDFNGHLNDIHGISDNVDDEAHNAMLRNEAEDRIEDYFDHADKKREERKIEESRGGNDTC